LSLFAVSGALKGPGLGAGAALANCVTELLNG
jgi:hypothetical protein